MKALHVALICKSVDGALEREARNMGMFSYPVPEFTWQHLQPGKGFTLDTHQLKDLGFDLVFHEDGGSWGVFTGHALPIVYYAIDSTISDEFHFRPRLRQGLLSDLILVDHDQLARFEVPGGPPVERLSYCVNDRLFKPSTDKMIDVNFVCSGGSDERAAMRDRLDLLCKESDLRYRSGVLPLPDYARTMSESKVVVVVPRTPTNRPHRVFDAMATGTAVLTTPLPDVSGELRHEGEHYLSREANGLPEVARWMVVNGTWELLALAGADLVSKHHTWAVRARQLRQMLVRQGLIPDESPAPDLSAATFKPWETF